jgi:hypothetical protein
LDLIQLIAQAIDHVVRAAIRLFDSAMTFLEAALRAPLQSIHITGALQTLILTMIPLLTLVAVVKLFGGFFRALFVLILILILAHVVIPIFFGSHVAAP